MRKTMDSRISDQDPGNARILARGNESAEPPRLVRRRREQPIDKEKVSAALQELAAEHARSPRSQTARLREVLDDVEAALTAGASHAAVLATLHTQGFTFTLRSFESTLGRLRKERKVIPPERDQKMSERPTNDGSAKSSLA